MMRLGVKARMLRLIAGSVLLIALAGCNTQAQQAQVTDPIDRVQKQDWTYPPDPSVPYRSTLQQRPDLVVAVLPFKDARPVTNSSSTAFLWLIPLMPYGWVNYERPEAARVFTSIPAYRLQLADDFAKATTVSFEESQLFRRVYFTLGGETREADLVLRGTARHTTYNGKTITYGLSLIGSLLWFIGLPAGTSTNLLDITLSLTDRDDRELWSYSFSRGDTIAQGWLYNWKNDALQFASLFQTAINEALQNLAPELPRIGDAVQSRGR
jgi:hypothetical protein